MSETACVSSNARQRRLTGDLEVLNGVDPGRVAGGVVLSPTMGPDGGEERGEVSDREEGKTEQENGGKGELEVIQPRGLGGTKNSPLGEETEAAYNISTEVGVDRREGISRSVKRKRERQRRGEEGGKSG